MASLIGAIDQGTSSSRFCVFDQDGAMVAYHQQETSSIYPKEGWVEQDPMMILNSVVQCMEQATEKLKGKVGKDGRGYDLSAIKAVGVTNQRESMLIWDRTTGKPLHNAIIWLDLRTSKTVHDLTDKLPGKNRFHFQSKCGLPLATYFSAVKYRWILDNATPEILAAFEKGTASFGTIDTWLIWNLTGGPNGGAFVTDVTNASRTMLMNLHTLQWDDELCQFFGIDKKTLPEIRSSSEIYGSFAAGPLKGTPIAGCAGDQQAALVGHRCFEVGQVKNTYGTGCFMLFNTGTRPVVSSHGLLTTVAYRLGKNAETVYALEGSVAIAGAGVTWLRDNLNIIDDSDQITKLAGEVTDTGGVYIVPAFSGLFAPYWRDDARGVIVGLTQKINKRHLCRAVLEAVCFQTKEVINAMNQDSGKETTLLKVDGGMTNSTLCMQIQADLLNIKIESPTMKESTALGAVILAGLAVGVWKSPKDIKLRDAIVVFTSKITEDERRFRFGCWKRAVQRTFNLAQDPDQEDKPTDPSPAAREAKQAEPFQLFDYLPLISGVTVAATFSFFLVRGLLGK